MRLHKLIYSLLFATLAIQSAEQALSIVSATAVERSITDAQTRCDHGAVAPVLTSVCCISKDAVFDDVVITGSLVAENVCANNLDVNNLHVQFTTSSTYYNNLNRGEQINGEREIFPAYGSPFQFIFPGLQPGALFGNAVAINRDGTIIAIGAPARETLIAPNVSIWMQQFDQWILVQNISGAIGSSFGFALAMSGDGNIIVAGAVDANEVVVILRTGPTTWAVSQTFTASNGSQLGNSVAISYDGRIIVGGAPGRADRLGGTAFSFIQTADTCAPGAAPFYVLEQEIIGTLQDAAFFGFSISLNGDGSVLAVGAPLFNQGTISNNGAVFMFTHTDSTGWTFLKQINPDPTQPGFNTPVQFGSSVALNGDATGLVIGAQRWIVGGQSTGVSLYIDKPLIFSNQRYSLLAGDARSGISVDISHDGRIFISGSVSPTGLGGSVIPWLSTAHVPVTNAAGNTNNIFFQSQTIQRADFTFGTSARISRDGGYIIVGAPTFGVPDTGTAWLYRTAGGAVPINLCVSRDLHVGNIMYTVGGILSVGNIRISPAQSLFASLNPPAAIVVGSCVDETTT